MMKPDFTWVQHLLGKMLPFAKWGWQQSLFLCSDHLVINKQEVGSIPSWLGSWAQKQRYYVQPDRPAFSVKMQHARPKTVSPEFLSSKSQSADMQLHCVFLLILTLVLLFVVAPMSSYFSSLGSWPLAMPLPGSSQFGSRITLSVSPFTADRPLWICFSWQRLQGEKRKQTERGLPH